MTISPLKYFVFLIFFAFIGLAAGRYYITDWNPEIRWLRNLDQTKRGAIDGSFSRRFLAAGGSSTLFGFDACLVERITGKPTINLGMHAGMGALAILGYAEGNAQSGDTILLSLEADLLIGEVSTKPLGNQFLVLIGKPSLALGGSRPLIPFTLSERIGIALDSAAPGLRQIVNHLGKILARRPLYRYQSLPVDSCGYISEKVYQPHKSSSGPLFISPSWKKALKNYVANLENEGIRVVYTPGWLQVHPLEEEAMIQGAKGFLKEINKIMPLLIESGEGMVRTDPRLFSDTSLHLSERGAKLHSEQLAHALLQGNILPRNP